MITHGMKGFFALWQNKEKQGGKSSPHHRIRIFPSEKQGGLYVRS